MAEYLDLVDDTIKKFISKLSYILNPDIEGDNSTNPNIQDTDGIHKIPTEENNLIKEDLKSQAPTLLEQIPAKSIIDTKDTLIADDGSFISVSTKTKNIAIGPNLQTSPTEVDVAIFAENGQNLVIDAITYLCYSIFSGEFLNLDNPELEIEKLIKKLEEILSITDETEAVNDQVIKFIIPLTHCLTSYKSFHVFFAANFTKDRIEDFFHIEDEIVDQLNLLIPKIRDFVNLFLLLLAITREDLQINSDISDLKRLAALSHQLEKLSHVHKSIALALDTKLNFLIYKWNQRYKRKNPEGDIQFRVGNKLKSSSDTSKKITKLKDWQEKIHFHYDFCTDKNRYKKYIHDIVLKKRKSLVKLSFLEIHSLIKFYKDIVPSEEDLKEILDHLLLFDKSKNKYDQYCIEIIRNYAINNYFSLITETKKLNLEAYRDIYHKCKAKLNHFSNNYFLQKKYLEYVLDKIDKEFEKSSSDTIIKTYEDYSKVINDECNQILDEYWNNKEWSKVHNNYIFILPSAESFVDLSELDQDLPKVLFFTSFVLPDYKDTIEHDYSKIRQKFREVKSLSNVIKNLKTDLKDLAHLNKEFDKKDLKSIEIISLFTAIITFVLSSIPAFKFVETVHQASLFMLALAASLGLFIIVIFGFTRGFGEIYSSFRNKMIAFVITFIFIVTAYSLVNFENRSVDALIKKRIKSKLEFEATDSLLKHTVDETKIKTSRQ
ncbi:MULTISPECIES: hypothetical protein [unclassified Sphingobacterium]|uniref:hypothetical protein n=1 Tax=unclassified Sphingobacterium TaxID=2609468 RepID=UPI00104FEFE8|nr:MULTISPECIES: hypothetical protein [unclassified Sphingobacterium]MCS3556622.1 hypothetical protein [Sphingobacterium sp. JUb21]TCQ99914.1 hypothetical protein EDF66_113139 [Sphingobacterium sp. JUb20]